MFIPYCCWKAPDADAAQACHVQKAQEIKTGGPQLSRAPGKRSVIEHASTTLATIQSADCTREGRREARQDRRGERLRRTGRALRQPLNFREQVAGLRRKGSEMPCRSQDTARSSSRPPPRLSAPSRNICHPPWDLLGNVQHCWSMRQRTLMTENVKAPRSRAAAGLSSGVPPTATLFSARSAQQNIPQQH